MPVEFAIYLRKIAALCSPFAPVSIEKLQMIFCEVRWLFWGRFVGRYSRLPSCKSMRGNAFVADIYFLREAKKHLHPIRSTDLSAGSQIG